MLKTARFLRDVCDGHSATCAGVVYRAFVKHFPEYEELADRMYRRKWPEADFRGM
jgi:hypothetical protein